VLGAPGVTRASWRTTPSWPTRTAGSSRRSRDRPGVGPAATARWAATYGRHAASTRLHSPRCHRAHHRRWYGQVTGWITGRPGNLDTADEERLRAIRARCPELNAAVRHVARFARMIKDLSGDKNILTKWMGVVDADLPMLRSFAAGLRRDLDAAVAGLTLEYRSGAVEGTVNRIKQLNMAMYGRAKPDLLRTRTLLT
jgi:transposase